MKKMLMFLGMIGLSSFLIFGCSDNSTCPHAENDPEAQGMVMFEFDYDNGILIGQSKTTNNIGTQTFNNIKYNRDSYIRDSVAFSIPPNHIFLYMFDIKPWPNYGWYGVENINRSSQEVKMLNDTTIYYIYNWFQYFNDSLGLDTSFYDPPDSLRFFFIKKN